MKATMAACYRAMKLSVLDLAASVIFILFILAAAAVAEEKDVCYATNNEGSCSAMTPNENDNVQVVPDDCALVMAPSTLSNAGWGVFTLRDRRRGTPIAFGDLVIPIYDIHITHADGMKLLLQDYLWTSEEVGAFYEGMNVMTAINGIAMLANGLGFNQHNVLPFVPTVDEGGLTRLDSPGAGASTHYHNYTFFVQKPIPQGAEIFVNYGNGWFQERKQKLSMPTEGQSTTRSVDWLRRNGRCLDNIRPGRSKIKNAGRGAFARRDLQSGSIILPVPVLPITKREALDLSRERQDGSRVETKQLLLNYCLGYANSSMLLYPYGPLFGLVNHGGPSQANVRLQWSQSNELHARGRDWLNMSLDEIKSQDPSGLLLELVATKDIYQGEEIRLNYGDEWARAWLEHVQHWKPVDGAEAYAPSYVHDDAIKALRTETELKGHPYPDNVFTSCFYRYSDNKIKAEKNHGSDAVTTFRWNMTRGLFELRNLRPCNVLQREQDKNGGTLFTVQVRNRYGLAAEERIPKGSLHIVTHVPRNAIKFSDKIYTTDMHLENAFRHELGIPDDTFPDQWKDL